MGIAIPMLHDGHQLFFRFMPEAHDPDSYIHAHGREDFLNQSKITPMSEHLLAVLQQGLSPARHEDRDKLMHRAEPYLLEMPESTLKDILVDEIAKLVGLSAQKIELRCRKQASHVSKNKSSAQGLSIMTSMVSLLLRQPDLIFLPDVAARLEKIELEGDDFLRELAQFILKNREINAGQIIEHWRGTKYESRLMELTPTESPYMEDAALYSQESVKQTFIAIIEKMERITKKNNLSKLVGVKSVSDLTNEHIDLLPGKIKH